MQGQLQQMAARDAGIKVSKPDRFTPLLTDVRKGLGDSWAFYEECIMGILADASNHQDPTAWFEQMQQLVEGVEKVQISHQGILFLLQEMGIRKPKQRSWGEGESDSRKYHSLPLSPPEELSRKSPTSTANMGIYRACPLSSMTSIIPLRPPRPNTPPTTNWPATSAPTPRPGQEQQQLFPLPVAPPPFQKQPHYPQVLRDGVLPFDFSATVQPGLTFPSPQDFRNYHCPPDKIIASAERASPPVNPLRKISKNPVLFSDPVLRADIAEAFGYEVQSSRGKRGASGLQQKPQRLPFDVYDDDLTAWKMRLEDGGDGEVKSTGSVSGTWPPWNYRFDLNI